MKKMLNCFVRIRIAASRRDGLNRRRPATPLNALNSSFILHPSSVGFTLVELMISIVLVLVIMVGIGKIFQLTSDTVGGGVAISTMTRSDRAAQITMQSDFAAAANDSPVFMICSERASAFLTPQDKQSDLDGDPMTVPNTLGVETQTGTSQIAGGSEVSPALYGDRNHRIDRIGFFARGQFTRQTSNDNSAFTGSPNSNEAYIWYGHVRLPGTTNDNNGTQPDGSGVTYQSGASSTLYFPHIGYKSQKSGQFDNDTNSKYYENNPIATNWVLGRMAILLRDESLFSTAGQTYYNNTEHLVVNPSAPLSPLGYQTIPRLKASSGSSNAQDWYPLPQAIITNGFIYRSRYDLAGTTISEYRSIVSAAYDTNQPSGNTAALWWWPLVYDTRHPSPYTTSSTTPVLPFRFECNPYISKPMTGTGMAQTVPYFLPHVTQFIVEYAGDFLTQDATTGVPSTTIAPDGTLDFYVDAAGRHIRWYGFPRDIADVNGGPPDGKISITAGVANYNSITDVVPLCDIVYAITGNRTKASFEQEIPTTAAAPPADYAAITGAITSNSHYYCVWRNAAPKLVRILMKIDDPNARVRTGRWIEQVFQIQ